jgi:hypothetical protein
LTAGSPLPAIRAHKRRRTQIVLRVSDCAVYEWNEPRVLLPRRDIVLGYRDHKESRL